MPKRALRTSSLPVGLAAEMPSMKSQQRRRCKDPQICPRGWCSSASARARKRRENLRATRTLRLKTRRLKLRTANLQGSS
ncbi:hypothetical protein OJAV_G00199070 [Oryzias javanicus]|uniref:Uncharacterized protein n=1 Tax=Oryzias javanicus TaxID=123683 RepID=A0A3S2M2Q7_ORYJA|nr:hypothetical protein OJAV_G00199070 [Oryzias javanicus]